MLVFVFLLSTFFYNRYYPKRSLLSNKSMPNNSQMMYTINKPTGTTMRDHPNSPPTFQQKTMTKSKSRYMKATNCPSQKSRYFNSNTSSLPPSFKTASSNSKSRHSKLSKRSSKSHKSKSKKRKRSSKTKRKSNSLKTKV